MQVTRTLFTLRNLIITLWRKAHRKLANWIYKRTTAFATIFLPQELVDIIIDYLADENDLNALRSCSLTSRCWVYRAQYHIHRRVTVRRYNNAAEPDTDWYSSARVAQLVQHLFLDTLPLIPDGTPPFPTMDHLWDTIFRFPCVTDLSISNGWWDYTEQERNAFGSHFRNLRSLSLCGIILPDQDTFLELIGEFPRLKSLAINPITFNQPKGEGITLSRWLSTGVPGSSIDHLTIGRGCFSTVLFEFLLQWLKVLSKGVHDGFTLQWQASLNIQVLPGVLRCLGTSLSQLSLDLHGIDHTILPGMCSY